MNVKIKQIIIIIVFHFKLNNYLIASSIDNEGKKITV